MNSPELADQFDRLGFAALLGRNHGHLHALAGLEAGKAAALKHRDMDEDILAAIITDDEAEAADGVEPLYLADQVLAVAGRARSEVAGRRGPEGGRRAGVGAAVEASTSRRRVTCGPFMPCTMAQVTVEPGGDP